MGDIVTPKVKEIIRLASKEAKNYGYSVVEPEHLLLAILHDNANTCIEIFNELNIDIDGMFNEVSNFVNYNNLRVNYHKDITRIPPSTQTSNIIKYSSEVAKELQSPTIQIEHLLLSLLIHESKASSILKDYDLSYEQITILLHNKEKTINMSIPVSDGPGDKKKPEIIKKDETPNLNEFCVDITIKAEENKIDPVIGRDDEIKRVAQILGRRKKNNPILIGEPGVGKTAIVEGLANLIKDGDCPSSLVDYKVLSLNSAAVVAGTKYRGQFEQRMKAIVDELIKSSNIILFIDEIHTMVGAGGSAGTQDMANILKPALARGEMQVIGATTFDEFRETIEKDGALTRRFQQVVIKEPNFKDTKNILMNLKSKYEEHHNVEYSEESITECVRMADRYITDRAMPDKAIDIMDECGSHINVEVTKPSYIEDVESKLRKVFNEKREAIKKQYFEEAGKLRDIEKGYENELEELKEKWENEVKEFKTLITPETVAEVTALITGIPLKKISIEESKKLKKMNDVIKAKVIGQDNVVDRVCKPIQLNKLGIGNVDRPIGSFLFIGNTGTGKTHLTKVIAEYLFGEDSLIRLDMNEYSAKFDVTKLIGAPPGYIGHEDGGKLTEQVRRKPHSVILFDEIEKAHPDIFNTLLNILDEGYITDSLGRKVNFRNSIIIMTSNVGVKEISQRGDKIGYGSPKSAMDDQKRIEEILSKSVKDKFNPEFLNRLDDIVTFNRLTIDDVIKMAEIEIKPVYNRLNEKGYNIKITPQALKIIAEEGYSLEYGARPLRKAIQKYVEMKVAEEIMLGNFISGQTFNIGASKKSKEGLSYTVK